LATFTIFTQLKDDLSFQLAGFKSNIILNSDKIMKDSSAETTFSPLSSEWTVLDPQKALLLELTPINFFVLLPLPQVFLRNSFYFLQFHAIAIINGDNRLLKFRLWPSGL
jgi:hypothetical protein